MFEDDGGHSPCTLDGSSHLRLEDVCLWRGMFPDGTASTSLAQSALHKLERHTWYLNGRLVIFALFSHLVNDLTKRSIADAMLLPENEECEIPIGKPDCPPILPESDLASFVTPKSW